MNDRKEFHPLQAQEIARAFNDHGVDTLPQPTSSSRQAGATRGER
jgi:hypothetical protein